MIATRDAFGNQLMKSAKNNDKILVLSADLSKATKTENFSKDLEIRAEFKIYYCMG